MTIVEVSYENLLFGKLKNFKFEFEFNFTIVFKVVKVENLKVTIQTLSFLIS